MESKSEKKSKIKFIEIRREEEEENNEINRLVYNIYNHSEKHQKNYKNKEILVYKSKTQIEINTFKPKGKAHPRENRKQICLDFRRVYFPFGF